MIDKPLVRLTKEHKDSIQINNIRNKKGDITTETEEIQKNVISYYKSLYSTKQENLDEMNNFLDKYQIPKLNQDQDQMGLVQDSIKPLRRPNTNTLQTIQQHRNKRNTTQFNSSYEVTVTLSIVP